MEYITDKINSIFLVNFFDAIKSPIIYKFLMSAYLTLIIALIAVVIYFIFPGEENDKKYIVVSMLLWVQMLRLVILFLCDNDKEKTVF
jgi:hypothetical protein